MRNAPTNSDDIIDSRDVVTRIEELESEREDLADAVAEAEENLSNDDDPDQTREDLADAVAEKRKALEDWDTSDEAKELAALKTFADQLEGYCDDWRHGTTLIRDSYFKTYAQELADDIGAVNKCASWPNNCIDWEQAASELQMDYSAGEFDGVTYWGR